MSQNLDQMISQRLRYLDPWVEERHLKKKLIVSLVVVTILLCIFGCTKKTEEISIEKNEEKK